MRINKVILLVGRRGSGKTYFTINNIIKPVYENTTKTILIIDTINHPSYANIQVVDSCNFNNMIQGSINRCFESDIDTVFDRCKNICNALIIIEDATKIIGSKLKKNVLKLIYDSKQKNVDLVFIFHGFIACPPDLFRIADELILLRTGDAPFLRARDIAEYDLVEKAYNKILKSKENYPSQRIVLY